MLHLDFKTYTLPFEFPFRISKGLKTHQKTMVVFLGLGGQYGLGEATEIGYYPESSLEGMLELLQKHQSMIARYAYNGPHRFWHYLHHLLPGQDFLISALDMASWDMWARLQGKAVYELLGYRWGSMPPTSYTLGISERAELLEKMARHPYPIYKLKVGGLEDATALETVLQDSSAKIRIDANEAWDIDLVVQLKSLLTHERIELLEQPFHREDIDALARFREEYTIPVIADEAISDKNSLEKSLKYYDGVNIKLSKCGGLTPALDLVQYIQKSNKKIMLGSMSESYIGAAAIAQLLPMADYVDIDGPLLLRNNVGSGLLISEQGLLDFEAHQGIGVRWQVPQNQV